MPMNEPMTTADIAFWVIYCASLVHVFCESWLRKRVRYPVLHTLMVAIAWPIAYPLWLFCWPGWLRQRFFGSDKERVRRRVEAGFAKRQAIYAAERREATGDA